MKYLDGFVNEVLRVYGPAQGIIFRECEKDIQVGDLFIKKGVKVGMGTIYNHFNPKYYPEPFLIKPERWIENPPKEPYVFTPFSTGPRGCIGKHLAL
jgi:cytochrome P450